MRRCAYGDRIIEESSFQDTFLQWIYGHAVGRLLMRPLTRPKCSKLAGRLMDSRFSRLFVRPFVCRNHISLGECEKQNFDSYNDFFTRKLKEGVRPVPDGPEKLVSPWDARLSVVPAFSDGRFLIKQTDYTLAQLLQDEKLAPRFAGGWIFVFRLSVEDYHRYIYVDDGIRSSVRRIDGVLHTVNPAANDHVPIYKENSREYVVQRSRHFGTILQMEVGAMMVGKIQNERETESGIHVQRGEEKGYFAFGGSTIVLLVQKGKVIPDSRILCHSRQGVETRVRQGQTVGRSCDLEG